MGRVRNQVGLGLVMVRLFTARQKETIQGKRTRKGDRGRLQQHGQNQDAYREDKRQELSHLWGLVTQVCSIYSSPVLLAPWAHPRLAAGNSICLWAWLWLKWEAVAYRVWILPWEAILPQGDTNKSPRKPMRPNPVSQSYRCPVWGMLPSLYPRA